MIISYEEALKAQQENEDKWLADPNVVSVGVVPETDGFGNETGNYLIQIGVKSEEVYLNAINHGQSIIPTEYVLHEHIPQTNKEIEKHIRITVVKEGKIEALNTSSHSTLSDTPSAIDNIHHDEGVSHKNSMMRGRPSKGGDSIGHPDITAGTLGLLVQYSDGTHRGKAYILSNNHVLAATNTAYIDDPIIQPGKSDSGVLATDIIAYLHRWVPLKNNPQINYVDAALAEVCGGVDWHPYVIPEIKNIGNPAEWVEAAIGMDVEKTGRTTGYTQGKIDAVNYSIKVEFSIGTLLFKNQIRTTSMSRGGDSGSCLFEKGKNRPVGLLFAGSASASFYNPISVVLTELAKPNTHVYPSGKTHHFEPISPLKILRRTSSTVSKPFLNSFISFNKIGSVSSGRIKPASGILAFMGFCLASATVEKMKQKGSQATVKLQPPKNQAKLSLS